MEQQQSQGDNTSQDYFEQIGPSGFVEYPTLGQILKAILRSPSEGIALALKPRPPRSLALEFKLFAITFGAIFTFILMAAIFIEERSFDLDVWGAVLLIAMCFGLMGVFFQILISAMVFGIKSIYGKASFRAQLLTGALCSIPICALIIALFVFVLFEGWYMLALVYYGGTFSFFFLNCIAFIGSLFIIEIIKQSLMLGGVRQVASWYGAPIIFVGSLLLLFKVVMAIGMFN